MQCAECGCYDQDAVGWVALLGLDPDDDAPAEVVAFSPVRALLGPDPNDDAPAEVVAFCPVCAAREFKIAKKTAETYT
jgi:hypothetical protein